ncbi:MAG TPA: bifunctional (p)ppGpp synthetase/guanosine-3',5'-bis(diphosphate) 3'-pyrophosphohydrolase [Steroidobacteraceae bacterium]
MRIALQDLASIPGDDLSLSAEAAEVMGALTDDPVLASAVLLRGAIGRSSVSAEKLARVTDPAAADIAWSLARLGDLGLPRDWTPAHGLDPRQAETLRKMLLAVVSDPRLVLARLAETLVQLRHARELPAQERDRLAVEARAVFAPLANRLGVWQIKWELEDLAFRYLEAERYREIATALNERRADRERYIKELCESLQEQLHKSGVGAEVYGRPKHMYSIFRKMQRKQLAFEQLFDVRALRVIVASVPDCYAALGIVHGMWRYIAGEFDDYIATPKGNFYRSIHTAVVGPAGRSVEVQIRTRQMHEDAELGVAAHWTYKEGGARDTQYERKIEWVRRLLEPQDPSAGPPQAGMGSGAGAPVERDFLEQMRTELFEDRIYALTPKGEVIDLPRGATPLDFAYHLHTSLGHRCRGAKVNARIVPLSHVLRNGEVVEIITGKQDAPSRDWMAPEQQFLVAPRNRAKVRAWFRKQDISDNRNAGRTIAERELSRTGLRAEQLPLLIQALQARDAEHLYQLLGEGAISSTQLTQAALRLAEPRRLAVVPRVAPARASRRGSLVEIEGVGDLPTTLARCCGPLRPQPIAGYVTIGRGVTIHRRECPSLARMRAVKPERLLQVEWTHAGAELAVQIAIEALDRRGLVRDLTDVLAIERLSIQAMSTSTDRGTAHVAITVSLQDLEQLTRVLRQLVRVPNVTHARRVR